MNWYADIDGKQYGPFPDRAIVVACVVRKVGMSDILQVSNKVYIYDEYGRHDIEIYQASP